MHLWFSGGAADNALPEIGPVLSPRVSRSELPTGQGFRPTTSNCIRFIEFDSRRALPKMRSLSQDLQCGLTVGHDLVLSLRTGFCFSSAAIRCKSRVRLAPPDFSCTSASNALSR